MGLHDEPVRRHPPAPRSRAILRFYLSAFINRQFNAMIPAASPFALTQSFSTEAFRPGMPANRDAIAAEPQMSLGRLSCDLGSIAATKDAIDDAISRGLMVNVLGTKVVAFGSRLALLNFVGAISCGTARASVKWDSQPALVPSVKWNSQPAPVLLADGNVECWCQSPVV